jgi:hypothetical protein
MRESIKMEDYDGFLGKFTKEEKTRILPLRWFGNLCERWAHYHLNMFLHYSDHDYDGFAFKYHGFMSKQLYKPYFKWGTIYKLDTHNDIIDYNLND